MATLIYSCAIILSLLCYLDLYVQLSCIRAEDTESSDHRISNPIELIIVCGYSERIDYRRHATVSICKILKRT